MKIKTVSIKNFKSVGNNGTTFNFDEPFNLIKGYPGKGKTLILSAITYCLFNENSDYKGNSNSKLPSSRLINDINKKEMVVEVVLDNGYTIRRGLAPALFEVENEKGININDLSSKKLDQNVLEQDILKGLTFDIFMTTNYLTNKPSSVPFLYMSKTQRKDYIEKLLDLRIVYYMNENLKPYISENTLQKTIIQSDINLTKSAIENEEYNIKTQHAKLEEQKQKLANYEEHKLERINEQNSIIETQKNEVIRLTHFVSDCNDDISVLKDNSISYNEDKYNSYMKKLNDSNALLFNLQNAIAKKKMEKDTFDNNKSNFHMCGECPTLEKIVGTFDYDKYKDTQIKSAEAYKKVQDDITKHKEEISLLEMLKSEQTKKDNEIKEIYSRIQETEYHINLCNNKIKNCETVISNINNESKPELFEISLDYYKKLKDKLLGITKDEEDNYNNKISLDSLKKQINDKEHKAKALKTYLPLFEKKLNDLLDKFLINQEFNIRAKLEDDFELSFTKNNKDVDIFSLSNGQKGLITLATTFSFLYLLEVKHQNSFNHLFIDEILDSGLNIEVIQVLDYLKELSLTKNVTVISHNNHLLDYPDFDKTIEVQKENGFSKYIES